MRQIRRKNVLDSKFHCVFRLLLILNETKADARRHRQRGVHTRGHRPQPHALRTHATGRTFACRSLPAPVATPATEHLALLKMEYSIDLAPVWQSYPCHFIVHIIIRPASHKLPALRHKE
jgi:hypothetical protein